MTLVATSRTVRIIKKKLPITWPYQRDYGLLVHTPNVRAGCVSTPLALQRRPDMCLIFLQVHLRPLPTDVQAAGIEVLPRNCSRRCPSPCWRDMHNGAPDVYPRCPEHPRPWNCVLLVHGGQARHGGRAGDTQVFLDLYYCTHVLFFVKGSVFFWPFSRFFFLRDFLWHFLLLVQPQISQLYFGDSTRSLA